MRVIYVAHPLTPSDDEVAARMPLGRLNESLVGEDIEKARVVAKDVNLTRAERWVCWVARIGHAPVASWTTLARNWGEDMRERGLAVDKVLVTRCDEVWLVGGRISEGMKIESKRANEFGIPVRDLTELGAEPPDMTSIPKHLASTVTSLMRS